MAGGGSAGQAPPDAAAQATVKLRVPGAAAYAPVAGSFWRPHPDMEACAGPVDLLHTHGWRDKTVPLD